MSSEGRSVEGSWSAFVEGLRSAGERLATQVAHLDPAEQSDAYLSLLRGLNNQLGRFEVDRELPELVFFNGWREKFFMDNPDFRYWVADVRDDRRYRITGTAGDAVYQSITAYAGGLGSARAVGRIDSDTLQLDGVGRFEVTVSRDRPDAGDWLPLAEGASMVWVRQFHGDASTDELGSCRIEPIEPTPGRSPADPARLDRHLQRLGATVAAIPDVWAASVATDLEHPNELRHWAEMAGGAAYTEPDIHYVRGSWDLGPDEALLIEGAAHPCRYWNVVLYSRFLNSLDFRHRSVSRTSSTVRLVDGRYRLVIAARDPGDAVDWLDSEGRRVGLVVMRWLHPEGAVQLPEVRRCLLTELGVSS
jgi:hypothetical protein